MIQFTLGSHRKTTFLSQESLIPLLLLFSELIDAVCFCQYLPSARHEAIILQWFNVYMPLTARETGYSVLACLSFRGRIVLSRLLFQFSHYLWILDNISDIERRSEQNSWCRCRLEYGWVWTAFKSRSHFITRSRRLAYYYPARITQRAHSHR